MNSKKLFFLTLVAGGAALSSQAQTTNFIADWTFQTSAPTTAGPISPEVGSGSATGFHAGATVYSSPAGNGSSHSYSSTLWAVGDYYQFQVSTVGFSDIHLQYDQISSSTGPGNFQLYYSTDGTTFNQVGSSYTVLANATPNQWSSGTPITTTTYSYDLSSFSDIDDANAVYFRVQDASTTAANGGTVATGGTDRMDNVEVFTIVVPEPSTLALLGLGSILGVGAMFRRKA